MHKYIVSANQRLTPSTILITLRRHLKNPKPFSFNPGQYATISFKCKGRQTAVRCFSIVSAPNQPDNLQFSVRTKGRFTNAMAKLQVGDEVNVSGPFGNFTFDSDDHLDSVFLAGGIGVTPFMSMVEHATTAQLNNKITMIYSVHDQDEIPFFNKLKHLETLNPNFKTVFAISDGPTDKLAGNLVARGRITPQIIDYVSAGLHRQKYFFVCGPPAFMKGMIKILLDMGVPENKIKTEAFNTANGAPKGQNRSWLSNIYLLSAAGVALATFAVMASDLAKTLQPFSLLNSNNTDKLPFLVNSRQTDLDDLVNRLPDDSSTTSTTTSVTDALLNNSPATPTPTKQSSNTVVTTPTPVPKTTATPAPPPKSTPTPTPTPKPTPKCTTTQSGVTTCV